MAMSEDVQRIVLGVIVLIIVVFALNQLFSTPECQGMANATAEELTTTINEVASNDFPDWESDNPPPYDGDHDDYYRSVPIRLCEEDIIGGDLGPDKDIGSFHVGSIDTSFLGASFAATTPSYLIVYEKFPESKWWYSWDESYPWGGGATNAVLAYAAIRWGPTIIFKGGGAVVKQNVKTAAGTISAGVKVIPLRIINTIKNVARKWDDFLVRRGWRSISKYADEQLYYAKYFPNSGQYSDVKTNVIKAIVNDGLDEADALAKVGVVKKNIDGSAVAKTVRTVDEAGHYVDGERFVVTDEYVPMMRAARDSMSVEERNMFDAAYYIPSKFERVEKIKYVWRGLGMRVRKFFSETWINTRVLQPFRDWRYNVKNIMNEKSDSLLKRNIFSMPEDSLQTRTALRRYVQENPDAGRQAIVRNWDEYSNVLTDSAGRKITSPDDLTDADVYRFFSDYEKNYHGNLDNIELMRAADYEKYLAAENGDASAIAEASFFELQTTDGIVYDVSRKIDDTSVEDLDFLTKSWDELTVDEKAEILVAADSAKLLPDTNQEKIISESWDLSREAYARSLGDEITLVPAGTTIGTKAKSRYAAKVEELQIERLAKADPNFEVIKDISLTPRATSGFLEKISNNKIERRITRFIFIDMGRSGIGPARLNPFAQYGTYSNRRALEKAQEVEGGCLENSLCILYGGAPKSYLLNTTMNVKIWRESYNFDTEDSNQRLPAFIQTFMFKSIPLENPRFYLASPCFGFAQVWKHDGTVYVQMQKCDAGGANNYCYADEAYVWGKSDQPLLSVYVGSWFAVFATCKAGYIPAAIVTLGASETATTAQCMRLATWTTQAAVLGQATTEASLYGEQQLDTLLTEGRTWGYWNYYKAADVCDVLDMLGSIGAAKAGKSAAKQGTKEVTNKAGKFLGEYAGDFCLLPEVLGDVSLAWPRVTPAETPWLKGSNPLTAEVIQEYSPKCAFTTG